MKTSLTSVVIALGALFMTIPGAAHADVQVGGPYASQAACQADGPGRLAASNGRFTEWDCDREDDGQWYLSLDN